MADVSDRPDRDGVKRGEAEQRADRAAAARRAGSPTQAERYEEEADRTDPEGLANDIAAAPPGTGAPADDGTATDEEVHLITGTIRPGSDAPSRAGITGSGSGADDM